MRDPFVGLWRLVPDDSIFDPNHSPREAKMRWLLDGDGIYVMQAEGVSAKGERVAERPQRFVADGKPHPVPDFPGLVAITSKPDAHTIRAEVRREDGTIAGEGTYTVSSDGRSLTATAAGFDSQLRRFETRTAWQLE